MSKWPISKENQKAVVKIVSGGQTGVDRAALDWAMKRGFSYGGWCPKGRLAEDGVLDGRYVLRETESKGYRQRTRQNVIDSDGTLILNTGVLSDGSLTTQRIANRFGKPCMVIQLDGEAESEDVERVMDWVQTHGIAVLNFAGPRESKRPGIYCLTLAFLNQLATVQRDANTTA